jgi:uroporphyrinogen-III decarboxylase
MPVFALGLEFDYRRAGLTYRDMRQDVDGMVRSQVEAVREYDYDWAILFPDDYVEFEPLGLEMRDEEGHPTMPSAYLPMTWETLRGFRIPDAQKEGRCPLHLEMLRRTKDALGETVLVLGRIAAPFSTLGLIYGIDELMIHLLTEPDLVRDNLRFFVDHQIAFGQAQLEAGADLLWLGDCCAASRFIRVEHFREFAFEPAAQVAAAMKEAGALIIYHTAETSLPYLQEQVQLPVDAVNVGEGVRLADLKKEIGTRRALMGNFDPMLLRDASPEAVAAETEKMVRENLPGGGYMFNTGEGVMQNSRPENVAAMMATARRIGDLAGELI